MSVLNVVGLNFLILNNKRDCLLDIAMNVERITFDLKNDLGNSSILRLIFPSDKKIDKFLIIIILPIYLKLLKQI